MDIGYKIKLAREGAGFRTQRALASAVGVSACLVSGWENDKRTPGRAALTRVSKATKRPLSYFIAGTPHETIPIGSLTADEADLVQLYRLMTRAQRRAHLALFRVTVGVDDI